MPARRGSGRYAKPNYGQASHIIKKFGGEAALAQLLNISRISVYRWNYQRPAGSDGLVPHAQRPRIESIARLHGILLLPSDWETTRIRYDASERDTEVIHASPKSLEELLS